MFHQHYPTPLLLFCSEVPGFSTLFELLVQPSSLKKMAHTAEHICCTSTNSCRGNTMENTSFHIKSGWTSQGCYKKHSRAWTFLSQVPVNGGSRWHRDRRAFPAGTGDHWLHADLGWLLLAGQDLTQCPWVKPSSVQRTHTKPPPWHGGGGQCTTVVQNFTMGHEFHSH